MRLLFRRRRRRAVARHLDRGVIEREDLRSDAIEDVAVAARLLATA
jgi:hypothetical protein